LNDMEFKRPILQHDTRILRPKEFNALLNACSKIEYKVMLQSLLYTGLRYIEMKRFQHHPDWFDGEFIHLPQEASQKVLRNQRERWVRLNNQGRMNIQFLQTLRKKYPTYQSWAMNMKAWGRKAGLDPIGLNVKTTRKTWESWLMFTYPTRIMDITTSQGHSTLISLNYYLGMPFTEVDRIEIKEFVSGWINNDGRDLQY